MDKEIKITPPEGYEVDKEHSTFECIKFKPIKSQLPKSWEEFCEVYPIEQKGGAYINNVSNILVLNKGSRNPHTDKNVLPSEEMAEAALALCQLLQLRDCYNQGWQPDWDEGTLKYCMVPTGKYEVKINYSYQIPRVLHFKTRELCEAFKENFKDLIEIAKPLL